MDKVAEKLEALRKIMHREKLDAYIISGTDPHNSEYLPDAWQQRKWISGFSGSLGTVVITMHEAGLWTDSRYFIQADKELAGSAIVLHKLHTQGIMDYPEWLSVTLMSGMTVGIDGFCTPVATYRRLKNVLAGKNIVIEDKTDLLGDVWFDRPPLPATSIDLYDEKYTGQRTSEKINEIRAFLQENDGDYILFSTLDEIAWLYNIRGTDIPYNPFVISYAIVGKEKAWLFVNKVKVRKEVSEFLESEGIEIRDYHHILLFPEEIDEKACFLLDTTTLNYTLYAKFCSKFNVVEVKSPVILRKAVKNQVEIDGFKQACIMDGVAVCRFIYWLEHNIEKYTITEIEASQKLSLFRKKCPDYIFDSFHTISAYGKNAALPHYSAENGQDVTICPKGLYLLDSGGQYKYGTTDITRTIPVGELTDLEKEDYTLVLKGMISLSRCMFPVGLSGGNLDIVARFSLWQKMRNYGHGTGHGVGHFLCVHEGPQDIRQNLKDQPFLPGMITSNEPGMYREGCYGIRHENLLLCKHLQKNEFGEWLGFETLTLCYFDTSPLLLELLTAEEKRWLNDYHTLVFEKLSPFLNPEEIAWLKTKTAAL